jgi:hypothetical protein
VENSVEDFSQVLNAGRKTRKTNRLLHRNFLEENFLLLARLASPPRF